MDHRSSCPLCNFDEFKIIERVNTSDPNFFESMEKNYALGNYLQKINYIYELRYCKNCGTRYQKSTFNDEESVLLYSKNIEPQKSFLKQLLNYKKNLAIRKKTAKFIRTLLGTCTKNKYKALEVGAGWGFFSYISKDYDINFTTIELSKERSEFHRFLKLDNVYDLKEAISNNMKFDLIYSNQVLEHISDLNDFIDSCKKLLVVNGFFIAEYPSFNNYFHYLSRKNFYYNDKRTKALEHLQLISDKGIQDLINKTDSFEFIHKFPIRNYGDRIKLFLQNLTPPKFKGSGFVVAKRIK